MEELFWQAHSNAPIMTKPVSTMILAKSIPHYYKIINSCDSAIVCLHSSLTSLVKNVFWTSAGAKLGGFCNQITPGEGEQSQVHQKICWDWLLIEHYSAGTGHSAHPLLEYLQTKRTLLPWIRWQEQDLIKSVMLNPAPKPNPPTSLSLNITVNF